VRILTIWLYIRRYSSVLVLASLMGVSKKSARSS
jgi:hypothetical protein